MPVLLAEPPDDREPRILPVVPPGTATTDKLPAEPVLWTFGGQARHRDAARQGPWS